jgi:hypothetical protein
MRKSLFYFKLPVSRPNIHISLCDDLFSLGIVSYLVCPYVVVLVIDLHLLPCGRAIPSGSRSRDLEKTSMPKVKLKHSKNRTKSTLKLYPCRLLSFLTKKHEGLAIYKCLLPFLPIKQLLEAFLFFSRGG